MTCMEGLTQWQWLLIGVGWKFSQFESKSICEIHRHYTFNVRNWAFACFRFLAGGWSAILYIHPSPYKKTHEQMQSSVPIMHTRDGKPKQCDTTNQLYFTRYRPLSLSLSLSSNLYGHVQSYGIYTDTRTHTHIRDGLSKCLCLVWLINRNSMRAASCLVLKTVTCLNNLKHCILSFMFETTAKTCRKCYVIYTYTCT